MIKGIKRGDVYWIDFGVQNGSEQGGQRPAVVIQNDVGNKYSPTVIVCPITSRFNKKKDMPTHVPVKDYVKVGLTEESQILAEQIITKDKNKITGYIGNIGCETMDKVDKAIEISVQVGRAKQLIENRVIKSIETKVKKIKVLDSLLVEMFLSDGDRDFDVMKEIVNDRKNSLKDLEMFSNKYGIDYKNYYNPIQENKLKRMVG